MNLPKEVATEDRAALSPSGKYELVVVSDWDDGIPLQSFQILDREDNVLYRSKEQFDVRHTTYFLWDAEDRVWVYSGDTGTLFWAYHPVTNQWEENVYATSNVSAPGFLKKIRPKWHPR